MKSMIVFILLGLSISLTENVCLKSAKPKNPRRNANVEMQELKTTSDKPDIFVWLPPTYLGLTLGISTRTEVKNRFGEANWEGTPEEKAFLDENEGETEIEYKNISSIEGVVVITLGKKSQIVKAITIYPNNPKSREEIVAEYGSDFFEVASYESMCIKPNRQIGANFKPLSDYPIALVYPNKGMYISIPEQNLISHIGYSFKCLDK
jgi:hypothetical protein